MRARDHADEGIEGGLGAHGTDEIWGLRSISLARRRYVVGATMRSMAARLGQSRAQGGRVRN